MQATFEVRGSLLWGRPPNFNEWQPVAHVISAVYMNRAVDIEAINQTGGVVAIRVTVEQLFDKDSSAIKDEFRRRAIHVANFRLLMVCLRSQVPYDVQQPFREAWEKERNAAA
jgi:hypothetical protein